MTRWVFAALGIAVVLGVGWVAVARALGRSGSRASLLVSVIAHWLAAYVLWSFAGGLAVHYGMLEGYDTALFGVLAVAGGVWQYRTQARQGRERGLAVFVAGQLLWLVIVLIRNGFFA
jgi:hypothetical protein